jgi:WD40 repeat protein
LILHGFSDTAFYTKDYRFTYRRRRQIVERRFRFDRWRNAPSQKSLRQAVSAAFSPDGARIVTASDDRTARIWDAATGKETSFSS